VSPEPASVAERVHRRIVEERVDVLVLAHRAAELAREVAPLLDPAAVEAVVGEVAARALGLGPLEAVLADPEVTEVMVNGPGPVWVERRGGLERLEVQLDRAELERIIERVVAPLGLRVDRTAPIADARLPDGSRVHAIVPPLAVDGPYLTVRRFGARAIALDRFASAGVAALLRWATAARMNVLVSGGTGAGKTTLLNALAACLPSGERIVTVEDTAELRLPLEHVVRLEARPANAEGAGRVTIDELVRSALRMRPDRIVVGEVRGAEALDMLQAMNTGHEGSLSTCHANSTSDALRRIETMVLRGASGLPLAAVREQVAAAIDLVVQVARRPTGARVVVAVEEVVALGDAAGATPLRTRPLAGPGGLHRLPSRPARAEVAAPDPGWVDS
jgi:pilus assembly protein CpaF